jgi:peroxiredoxin
MPLFQQAFEHEMAEPDGVVILTINIRDSSPTVRDFMEANGYTFPALTDTGGRTARAYGISAIPITFMIGRDGTVRHVKRGKFLSINEINAAFSRIR